MFHWSKNRINPLAGKSGTRNFWVSPVADASASAAPYPLRTAPSIVAGHPVAVQSPARKSGAKELCERDGKHHFQVQEKTSHALL